MQAHLSDSCHARTQVDGINYPGSVVKCDPDTPSSWCAPCYFRNKLIYIKIMRERKEERKQEGRFRLIDEMAPWIGTKFGSQPQFSIQVNCRT